MANNVIVILHRINKDFILWTELIKCLPLNGVEPKFTICTSLTQPRKTQTGRSSGLGGVGRKKKKKKALSSTCEETF